MWERLFVSVVIFLLTGACYAQLTAKDSLRLKNLLKEGEELKLNKEAVNQIDFNSGTEVLRMSEEKPWMRFDESLPRIIPPSVVVEKPDSLPEKRRIIFRLPLDTLIVTMSLNLPPPEGISLGNGVRVNGGTFSGLDLLQVFTKEFWQFRKKRMRVHTVRALEQY